MIELLAEEAIAYDLVKVGVAAISWGVLLFFQATLKQEFLNDTPNVSDQWLYVATLGDKEPIVGRLVADILEFRERCLEVPARAPFSLVQQSWSRLSEQSFRVNRWSLCRG
ncbi:hypothetical protein [Bradyrhizobium sp. 145]|uniref:hypothetical protein n=1 Tax=Bradyrhizobium sp. 145 TaxID=2782621 RepID=UPI001FFBB2E8|nr:hypothetical protein [Bradyrhizobium sp. 145]MCK1691451.1 hypothetical protein [Bradyrhizobium sp. 145]